MSFMVAGDIWSLIPEGLILLVLAGFVRRVDACQRFKSRTLHVTR